MKERHYKQHVFFPTVYFMASLIVLEKYHKNTCYKCNKPYKHTTCQLQNQHTVAPASAKLPSKRQAVGGWVPYPEGWWWRWLWLLWLLNHILLSPYVSLGQRLFYVDSTSPLSVLRDLINHLCSITGLWITLPPPIPRPIVGSTWTQMTPLIKISPFSLYLLPAVSNPSSFLVPQPPRILSGHNRTVNVSLIHTPWLNGLPEPRLILLPKANCVSMSMLGVQLPTWVWAQRLDISFKASSTTMMKKTGSVVPPRGLGGRSVTWSSSSQNSNSESPRYYQRRQQQTCNWH